MISTLLVEYAFFVPIGFLLLLIGCILLGSFLLRDGSRGQRALTALALMSALPVLLLTLLPSGDPVETFCAVGFAWPTLRGVETLANIALLLPAVFFLTLRFRRPIIIAVGASTLSAFIELVQALLPVIGRACDTTDWQMNTIGAIVGALIGWLTYKLTPISSRADSQAIAR